MSYIVRVLAGTSIFRDDRNNPIQKNSMRLYILREGPHSPHCTINSSFTRNRRHLYRTKTFILEQSSFGASHLNKQSEWRHSNRTILHSRTSTPDIHFHETFTMQTLEHPAFRPKRFSKLKFPETEVEGCCHL